MLLRLKASVLFALVCIALICVIPVYAQSAIGLGAANSFAVLASVALTNTGPTIINGNIGLSPGTGVVGFPPGIVVPPGTVHTADALALQARNDATSAYGTLQSEPCGTDLSGQNLGGLTLTPGVYCFTSSALLTGALTLNANGNPSAFFVFKMGSTLTTASASSVQIINGGSSCNIWFVAGSSVTLGTNTRFAGSLLAQSSITLTTGANVAGRALALTGAVTLDTNHVGATACGTGAAGAAVENTPATRCTDTNFENPGIIRSHFISDKDRADLFCRLIPNDSPQIGNQDILNLGVIAAVDVFSMNGTTHFEGDVNICLLGVGNIIFLDASSSPRVPQVGSAWTTDVFPGYTCTTIHSPGTVILVRSKVKPEALPKTGGAPPIFNLNDWKSLSLDTVATLELIIPALNIKSDVMSVGLTDKNAMEAPKGGTPNDPLWQKVFWYRGGVLPGQIGMATIAGHFTDTMGRPAVFGYLSKLRVGDVITVLNQQTGESIFFVVTEIESYTRKEITQPDILTRMFSATDDLAHLTLFTCDGDWTYGSFNRRLVVYTTQTKERI